MFLTEEETVDEEVLEQIPGTKTQIPNESIHAAQPEKTLKLGHQERSDRSF
jgi:hypothetical protein